MFVRRSVLLICVWVCPLLMEAKLFFLSTPHSGTHLTYSYLQALTGKPVYRLNKDFSYELKNPLEVDLDFSKEPVFRTHSGALVEGYGQKGDKLLFILRDFKENLIRNFRRGDFIAPLSEKNFKVRVYIENLRVFDRWDERHRLLVRYEDLIEDPMSVMERVLLFLGEEIPANLNEDYLSEVRSKILEFYESRFKKSGGSYSKGEDVHYHTKGLSQEDLKKMEHFMKERYPDLWTKYLYSGANMAFLSFTTE